MWGSKEKKFEEAFEEFADSIFRYCYFRISDRERAKDLVGDVFTRAWKYVVDGNEIEDIKPFLFKIAHNLVVNELSRRKQHTSLEEISEDSNFDIEDERNSNIEEQSEGKRILEFITTLEELDRSLLTLRYIEDLSLKEISEILGISQNNATVKLHRVTKKLKNLYNKES